MAKRTPNTPTKKKGDSSPFRKFARLAKKIVTVPKDKVQEHKRDQRSPS